MEQNNRLLLKLMRSKNEGFSHFRQTAVTVKQKKKKHNCGALPNLGIGFLKNGSPPLREERLFSFQLCRCHTRVGKHSTWSLTGMRKLIFPLYQQYMRMRPAGPGIYYFCLQQCQQTQTEIRLSLCEVPRVCPACHQD